ncbi:MAG TPA: 5'-3' exonuclease H3TH domain-containing protein, partial [Aquabacterium sp.]|nr:5'-3' exonuclease H3TH domain-containing protein [Aquabacterium sp.]
RLREQVPAEHAVCVFDAKGPTFRDEWYPEYKAHRPSMPDDLRAQIEPIHEVVKLLGWPILEVPGIEADDAIGTLAKVGAASGHRVVVSTGDKDMAQLVNDKVTLVNTMTDEALDEAGVQTKFGVPPNLIIDYLTLIGDTVDNVPGVEKVGPKTAVKWIAEHGSLDGVMAAAGSIKGVAGENLRKALDWLPQGRRLITIVTDCDLSGHVSNWPALDALALREPDTNGLMDFYGRYGFKTELARLKGGQPPAAPKKVVAGATDDLFGGDGGNESDLAAPTESAAPIATQYDTVLDWATFDRWLARIQVAELVAFDTETDSLDAMQARIVGLSFSDKVGEACYIPLRHEGVDVPQQLPFDEVMAKLKPWLEDASR